MLSSSPLLLHQKTTVMNPRVRQLYKELIFTASLYSSLPLETCRNKIKKEFFKNKDLAEDSVEFKKALAWGRWQIKEMQGAHEISLYRKMRNHYEEEDYESMAPTPFSDLTKPKPHTGKKKNDENGNEN